MEDMMARKDHNLMKRNDVWYLSIKMKGLRIIRSLSTESVLEARERRDELIQKIQAQGVTSCPETIDQSNRLFGEIAIEWSKIIETEVKASTMQDYRDSMNSYVLPRFGNRAIGQISYVEIKKFVSELTCSAKRKNNILVPMRSVFKMAFIEGIMDRNPMDRIRNLKTDKPDIFPLSMEQVTLFLDKVNARYRVFFVVAFFTGMRFGEMAALKWKNVDFKLGVIKVRETRVKDIEGRPKTKKSVRDVNMMPPVSEVLIDAKSKATGKSDYVFLNQYGKPLKPMPVNFHIWKPALKEAGLEPRSLYQTRHTFATLMLDAGEHPGWVQKMMGHETMQMIYERYYSYIKNYERDEGAAFMTNVYGPSKKGSHPAEIAA
ncbi:MAG: site-specific integrase [Desulfobacterium sp.]|nr:site-specific integrase [Desulfobacterium sp.]